jgi:hypothetical protein
MQSADFGDVNHRSQIPMIILAVAFQNPAEMIFIDHDYMVEALSPETPNHLVLRQNLVTIDIVDFLQPSATLYWFEGLTILAVLLFQSISQRSMQFGS